jgi:putative ABC transport system permease protein
MLIKIALHSLASRRTTALITVFSIAICLFVLLGIGHIRQEAKHSFSQAVSGVDLIVGPRTGQLNLLLYSVFRLGGATNNIDWHSFQTLAKKPDVAWAIPLSLGDSHRGYPVLGTTDA